jgi:aminoglycoside/choline kinase family phosphotransferase
MAKEKNIEKVLTKLFDSYFFEKVTGIKRIKDGVSEKKVFKIESKSYVCTGIHNPKLNENKAFIEFSKSLGNAGLNVPDIYTVSENGKYYLEEFLGDRTLFYFLINNKITRKEKLDTYKKILSDLISFQIKGKDVINYKYCYETKSFNKKQIYFDFNKFYNYYLCKLTRTKLSKKYINNIKKIICDELLKEKELFFMYRDFQPRNIMLKDDGIYYIDYQSGRKGPLQYDVASFLYSGSINLTEAEKKTLLNFYINKISKKVKIDKDKFKKSFYYFVLIRVLQVLGSYGYTYFKNKDRNMLSKMKKALSNIKSINSKLEDNNLKSFTEEISKTIL